jgi:hypothetical protein
MDRLARRDEAERGNRFVVDTTSATLATNRVVVQRTQIGYVCVGMGRGSRLLHRAFDDASTSATDDALAKAAASAIVDVPLATHGDPHLRRLALMVALAKEDGFDPSEPRDERGRWTTGGVADGATASGASAGAGADEAMAVGAMAIGATATTDAGIGPALAELGPAAISSLSRLVGGVLAGGGAGLVAFLGTLLMRSQTGAVTEGRLPERDDIRRYDPRPRDLPAGYRRPRAARLLRAGEPGGQPLSQRGGRAHRHQARERSTDRSVRVPRLLRGRG